MKRSIFEREGRRTTDQPGGRMSSLSQFQEAKICLLGVRKQRNTSALNRTLVPQLGHGRG